LFFVSAVELNPVPTIYASSSGFFWALDSLAPQGCFPAKEVEATVEAIAFSAAF
jgi:hypothetical protein